MTRSENGKALPYDSKEMTSIVTYLQWISSGVPVYASVPWLGIEKVKSDHKPDKNAGGQVFTTKCSTCHGNQGQGLGDVPPLWGDGSFNDGAGMASPANLAGFAHMNMPRGNPDLTPEQALDVAEFVDNQPRSHFQKQ
ncbi:MAG: c-type cytochrome [Rudaea sp.]